jgi:hypothetical protein
VNVDCAILPLHPRELAMMGLALLVGLATTARGQTSGADADTAAKKRARDLARRLIDPDAAKKSNNVMADVLTSMNESRDRLHRDFDPGPTTQQVQVRIIEQLDDAIAQALLNRSESSQAASGEVEERTMPDTNERDKRDENKATATDETGRRDASGGAADEKSRSRSGPFRESKRGWGSLPPRDREEIMQGIDEEFLEQYRDLIERYYKALAEGQEP